LRRAQSDDDQLWGFEHSLMVEGADNHREKVDAKLVMVLPRLDLVLTGQPRSRRSPTPRSRPRGSRRASRATPAGNA
jgi:hypothetical protein